MTDKVTVPNASDVPDEARVITKELLEETLKKSEKRDNIIVQDFKVSRATVKGDNYACIVLRVLVTAQVHEEKKYFQLIIKTLQDNEFTKDILLNKTKLVAKEIMAYKEVIPALIELQRAQEIEPIFPSVPKFLHSVLNEMQGIVILQDLCPEGYKMSDRRKGLDYNHCQLVMEELGKFHALSYAMKKYKPDIIKEKFSLAYVESFYSSATRQTMMPFIQLAIKTCVDLAKAATESEEFKKCAEKLLSMDIYSTMRDILKPEEPYSILCHGDVWCNNIMFKYDNGEENKPTDVKLMDLQIMRYCLPTTDLAYFLFTSTNPSVRKLHLNSLLHTYHDAFINTLKHVKVDSSDITFELLQGLFKKTAMFGIITACITIPGMLSKPEDTVDIFECKNQEEFVQIIEKMQKGLVQKIQNNTMMKDRIIGTIQEAIDMGVL